MAYLPYSTPTFAQYKASLALRQNDPNNIFWADAENGLYIIEALRTWNALTGVWKADFPFNTTANEVWYSIPGLASSPRAQTVTDVNLYTMIEYHFLEPPTGASWTGTPQFSIPPMAGAIQRRRDELIQVAGLSLAEISVPWTGGRRIQLPSNVLEVQRIRWVPSSASHLPPVTLWRDDGLGFEYFTPNYPQDNVTGPENYAIVSSPPLILAVDNEPTVAGSFDIIVLQSGVAIPPIPTPPYSGTVLGVPDDLSWIVKWGAMSDLLGAESEATDPLRAAYCLQRYQDGIKLAIGAPWAILAQINGVPVDTPAVSEMDAFAVGWDSNPSADPMVIQAGVDFIGISPTPGSTPVGVLLTLVENAPVPSLNADPIQAAPDVLDAILDYAQHLAAFKQGGAEFTDTVPLAKNFAAAAMATNTRLENMGLFADVLNREGHRQQEMVPRMKP